MKDIINFLILVIIIIITLLFLLICRCIGMNRDQSNNKLKKILDYIDEKTSFNKQ